MNRASRQEHSDDEIIPTASLDLQFNPQTHEAFLTFPGLTNAVLTDGNWRFTINSQSVRDTFGNQLDGNGDRLQETISASISSRSPAT